MNQQLWQAHLENTRLRQENARLRRERRRPLGHCMYCGAGTGSVLRACPAHHDLPAIDPEYAGIRERMFAERTGWRQRAAHGKVAA